MKINNNLIQNLTVENKITSKKQAVDKTKNSSVQKFDQIIIDKSQAKPMNESEFASSLAAKVSGELKSGTDSQKILNIQSDIQRGDYNISSDEIIRKMMIGLR